MLMMTQCDNCGTRTLVERTKPHLCLACSHQICRETGRAAGISDTEIEASIQRLTTCYEERRRAWAVREAMRDAARQPLTPVPPDRERARLRLAGVYIVQLLQREASFKIGYSGNILTRLPELRQTYGDLCCIAAIPHPMPRQLEKSLHAVLARYRIYEEAGASEIFVFKTKAAQKVLLALLARYATAVLADPQWHENRREQDVESQPGLFS